MHPAQGFVQWQRQDELGWYMRQLHANESVSPFSETFGESLTSGIASTQYMAALLDPIELATSFDGTNNLMKSMEQVARVIKTRGARQVERDVFFVSTGGWDTHNEVTLKLIENFGNIDQALSTFATEMRAQGVWENVIVQEASEFGRTLASNGRGSDHGWGGNAFVVGGAINGSRVHGIYPSTLRLDSEQFESRRQGRVIPTTPWEALWQAHAQWLGVTPSAMTEVLPNKNNFPPEQLLTKEQLFGSGA